MMGSGRLLKYLRSMLAASCTVYPVQSRPFPYLGGVSKAVFSSLILFSEPARRKIPSTSVALGHQRCARYGKHATNPFLSGRLRTLRRQWARSRRCSSRHAR
ncbi:hypothetical protein FB567DRAFT_87003 [Paraphoma chrysanthemicola]|uniref:Uncharacterized protein n=1 Tax=Paraphoma chrysanthemicola TaxID=798071 RepID=A0A8K0R3U4_9PLEO|nr:hypothetical protein FB567DRAFT_87003 [Paraphoma chrysanthemicola]